MEQYHENHARFGLLTLVGQLAQMLSSNWTRVIDLFRQWDTNSDGFISKQEFIAGMGLLGLQVRPGGNPLTSHLQLPAPAPFPGHVSGDESAM